MEIKRLNWDSNFFKKEIYSCTLSNIDEYYCAKEVLVKNKADLCYMFISPKNQLLISKFHILGLNLYDKKVTYFCDDLNAIGKCNSSNIQSYKGNLTKELLELSFLAGHDSRFNKDPLLSHSFKDLYQLWLENSLNRLIADEFFVYKNMDNDISGFVTCKKENITGKIGLIATNKIFHRKGIGLSLVQASHAWYLSMNLKDAIVVTQGSNINACKFYENCGYNVLDQTLVYHFWL